MTVYGRAWGLRTVSLRYFNVFGPRQVDDSPYTGVIAIFARALLEGRAPTIHGDGGQTRDFNFVDNVVAANLSALEAELEPGTVINVGGGDPITLLELYDAIAKLVGVDLRPLHGPPRAGDIRHSSASLERARELLGYDPLVDWRTGLERTVAWYAERVGRALARD
jgi:UDP-glucose 4-epimerase